MKRAAEVLEKYGFPFEARKMVEKLDKMEMAEDAQMMPEAGNAAEGALPEVRPPGVGA